MSPSIEIQNPPDPSLIEHLLNEPEQTPSPLSQLTLEIRHHQPRIKQMRCKEFMCELQAC